MPRKNSLRVVDKCHNEVQSYIEQLMNIQNSCEYQSNESNNIDSIDAKQNDESGSLKAKKVRGPTLLKDIWNMSPGKTLDVQFNSRNQAIGNEGRKLSSFLGIVARNQKLTPLNIDDWRSFDQDQKKKLVEIVRRKFSIPACGEEFVKKSIGKKWKDYKCELRCTYMTKYKTKDALMKNRPNRIPRDQWTGLVSYWLSDKGKKRSQANRLNRTKQKMPHTGGSKSIGTLMAEKAKDGIEPTRAEIFILTHKKRKDGRPLDEESANVVDMMQVKLNSGETSNKQPSGSVAWKGDVYSQVLGEERSGYIRGLGLGPTPSQLWGTKSMIGNILASNMSNEVVQRLEQEVKELKKSKEKYDEEMGLMKQNQDKLVSELSFMREVLYKYFPTELPMAQNFNRSLFEQVPSTNSGCEQAHQVDKKIAAIHGNMFKPSGSIKPEIKSDEISAIKKDFDKSSHLVPTDLHLKDTKYMVIKGDSGVVNRGKKNVDPKIGEEKKIIHYVDDGIRPNANLADLTKLKPTFQEDESTTKGAIQKSMVKVADLASLLKLLRKDNDEAIRKQAAEAFANLVMNGGEGSI